MEAFDARRPAISEPKPEQTIRAQPFYGGYIGKEKQNTAQSVEPCQSTYCNLFRLVVK